VVERTIVDAYRGWAGEKMGVKIEDLVEVGDTLVLDLA
jgi:hypothetical protein